MRMIGAGNRFMRLLKMTLMCTLLLNLPFIGIGNQQAKAAAGTDFVGWQANFFDNSWRADSGLAETAYGTSGVKLTVKADANPSWQHIGLIDNLTFNMADVPKLRISVPQVSGGQWSVKVGDGTTETSLTGGDTSQTGVLTFDIAQLTGWTGKKSFYIHVWAIGDGSTLTIDSLQIVGANPIVEYPIWQAPLTDPTAWVRGQLTLQPTAQNGFNIRADDTANPPWQSLVALKSASVNMAARPMLKMKVSAVDPGGAWSVKVSNGTAGDIGLSGDMSMSGEFVYDLSAATSWTGVQDVTVAIWVIGTGKSATVDDLRIVGTVPVSTPVEQQTPDVAADATVPSSADLLEQGDSQRRDLSIPNAKIVINPYDFGVNGATTNAVRYSNRPTLPLNLGFLNAASRQSNTALTDAVTLYKDTGTTGGITYGWQPAIDNLAMWTLGLPDQANPNDLQVTVPYSGAVKLSVASTANPVWQSIYTKNAVTVNLDQTSQLQVNVPESTGSWSLKVNDGTREFALQGDTSRTGKFLYDIKQLTGWSGVKSFKVYLFSIGDGSTVTFENLAILNVKARLTGASNYTTQWTPYALPFNAGYMDGSQVQGKDFFYDENTVVRTMDFSGVTAANGMFYLAGRYSGNVSWNQGILTIDSGTYSYAIATNIADSQQTLHYYGTEGEMLSGTGGQSQPLASGYWVLPFRADSLPSGKLILTTAFSIAGETVAAAQRATAPLTADLAQVVHNREAYWDRYLQQVPRPQRFDIPNILRKGATAAEVKHAYYTAWIQLAENVLPPDASVGYDYPQMAAGKASMWGNGEPTAPYSASWDSLMGIQAYAYVDPSTAWDAFRGIMSLVQEDGQLGGESLPSRKAQTAMILYNLTGNMDHLQEVYPALKRYMNWRIQNPRWIFESHNDPYEKDAEFVVSALIDIEYLRDIAKLLGLPADVQDWEAKRAALFANYQTWFWPTPTSIPFQYYESSTGARAAGNTIWVTTGLYLNELQGDYLNTMMMRFNAAFDPNKSFAGFVNPKQPDWGYTIYGLIAKGHPQEAASLVQAAMRDIIRSGSMFAENYSIDAVPVPEGVRPSAFGTVQMIENVLLRNGFDYDKGVPHAVRLFDGDSGVNNITVRGKTMNIAISGSTGTVQLTGSFVGEPVTLPIAMGGIVNLDTKAPIITVKAPVDGSSQSDAGDLVPQIVITDDLSGVEAAQTAITLDNQPLQLGAVVPLYTLPLGAHTLKAAATDLAGNTRNVSVTFTTTTSIDSLKLLVTRFLNDKKIDEAGVANSLLVKLKDASGLKSFMNEVRAQSGKHISNEAANCLLRDANALQQ